jgi:hypothetical protein
MGRRKAAVWAAAGSPVCTAGTCSVTFATPGTGYLFPVAADVSSLSVVLLGGAGGGVAGGYGAPVTATLDVAGTSSLGIDVGGAAAGASGGINGGGDGGAYTGSGGGATDLTVSGTRLLVGGGGSGSGATT